LPTLEVLLGDGLSRSRNIRILQLMHVIFSVIVSVYRSGDSSRNSSDSSNSKDESSILVDAIEMQIVVRALLRAFLFRANIEGVDMSSTNSERMHAERLQGMTQYIQHFQKRLSVILDPIKFRFNLPRSLFSLASPSFLAIINKVVLNLLESIHSLVRQPCFLTVADSNFSAEALQLYGCFVCNKPFPRMSFVSDGKASSFDIDFCMCNDCNLRWDRCCFSLDPIDENTSVSLGRCTACSIIGYLHSINGLRTNLCEDGAVNKISSMCPFCNIILLPL
jgi:hypothetical protein